MPDSLEKRFREAAPKGVDFWSVRRLDEIDEAVSVRQDVPQPTSRSRDTGAMITVVAGGGLGCAATCDLSSSGLARAAGRAAW